MSHLTLKKKKKRRFFDLATPEGKKDVSYIFRADDDSRKDIEDYRCLYEYVSLGEKPSLCFNDILIFSNENDDTLLVRKGVVYFTGLGY